MDVVDQKGENKALKLGDHVTHADYGAGKFMWTEGKDECFVLFQYGDSHTVPLASVTYAPGSYKEPAPETSANRPAKAAAKKALETGDSVSHPKYGMGSFANHVSGGQATVSFMGGGRTVPLASLTYHPEPPPAPNPARQTPVNSALKDKPPRRRDTSRQRRFDAGDLLNHPDGGKLEAMPRNPRQARAEGSPVYFKCDPDLTGKTCPRGHLPVRFTVDRHCVECDQEDWELKKGRARANAKFPQMMKDAAKLSLPKAIKLHIRTGEDAIRKGEAARMEAAGRMVEEKTRKPVWRNARRRFIQKYGNPLN